MESIIDELIKLADNDYKKFNSKLCPDTKKQMLGIRIPNLRKLAKNIIKDNIPWNEFVRNENPQYFEEVILQGLIICYSKMDFDEKLEYLNDYVLKIDSWAINDTVVPTLKVKKCDLEKYWEYILPYTKSSLEFEVRFAVVSMLDYFIIDDYVDKVLIQLNKISHDGYYVKMAVAWALAEIGIKYHEKAINFLKENSSLDKFTYNKALQKMIESYRISDKQKENIKKMKIK